MALASVELLALPPATSTLPFESSVAVWLSRAPAMVPVVDQVPEAGSYNSAPAKDPPPDAVSPPVTSTLPLDSNVAVWPMRRIDIEPVYDHMLVAGSYSWALASNPL